MKLFVILSVLLGALVVLVQSADVPQVAQLLRRGVKELQLRRLVDDAQEENVPLKRHGFLRREIRRLSKSGSS
eukprot:CAMPEP_0201600990 /NCGR_PEP_ID=MMETSP0492-20130828/2018_1 /ASSEMBLY_ACC=CAM_ASM_000837 /TAXON_ID=420259 /ORGANISM="Thalassiosira gravida, Strain GMp14c1" /LENGTH=72 /DNA_ID=CAMNT_0048064029 /DNA_START=654 /DNA_END=868 /DNA_ORIENTATION=+